MYDDKEGVVPGNALVVDPNKQFRPLSKYGNAVSSIELKQSQWHSTNCIDLSS